MAAVFTAADIAGLSTSVSALVVGFVGVGLIFLAKRYVGRLGIR